MFFGVYFLNLFKWNIKGFSKIITVFFSKTLSEIVGDPRNGLITFVQVFIKHMYIHREEVQFGALKFRVIFVITKVTNLVFKDKILMLVI